MQAKVCMYRSIEEQLLKWKESSNFKPLLLRGARQVGKSYVVEKFGTTHFEQLVTINFELESKFITCFGDLDPKKIIRSLEILVKQDIHPGKTLLFFDEIQQCPRAIVSLRYFKEKIPQLHVIGAGSFLEFVINDEAYQEPVGRVQSLFMRPCSFYEFLMACGENRLISYLSTVTVKTGIDQPIHALLLEKCREYCILGGMPEVIDYFVTQKKFLGCEMIHSTLLEYYQRDFAKYQGKLNIRILQKIFQKVPALIAKHFKYVDIDPDIQPREQKPALEALVKAGIIYPVYSTSAAGLPFEIGVNEKKFKLLFLDIGLANHATGLDINTLLNEDLILMNRGALSEQFVGQELLAYGESYKIGKLYYWSREKKSSQAEVDYLMNVGSNIYPVEVKSGKTGRLKSIHIFLAEKGIDFGVQISQNQLSFENQVLSVPLYMVHELKRLVSEQ
jgi:predicted AAA+ superfamily ATPase